MLLDIPAPPATGVILEWVVWGIALLGGTIVTVRQAVSRLVPRLKRAEELAEAVAHEVRPNSGGSMRDTADRTEAAVVQLVAEVAALRDDVSEVRQVSRRHDKELGRIADANEQIRDRITRSEDRQAAQLNDHSQRIHYLEAKAHQQKGAS